jgi:hypothetical protein
LAVRSTLSAAVIQIVVTFACLVVGLYTVRWARRNYVALDSRRDGRGDGYAGIGIMVGVVAAVAFLFLMSGIHQILNVEFYAIKSLVPGL